MPSPISLLRRSAFVLLLLVTPAHLAAQANEPARGASQATLVVQAGEEQPLALTRDRLAALPQATQRVTQRTGRGETTAEWSGPLLWTVLTGSGLVDPDRHGDHARLVVRVTGRDGYTVVVALAELAPDYQGKPILIALRRDGTDLVEGALRLVVPGDGRAGRSVRDLARIDVIR